MAEVQRIRIEAAVREILEAIGEDPERPGLTRTPSRVAAAYEQLFSGIGVDPVAVLQGSVFPAETHGLVLMRDIRVHSICEHHLLPFTGVAHVAYLPQDDVVGLSRIPRAVEILSARPQIQENLTEQIADAIDEALHPRGVLVMLQCVQSCVSSRDTSQPDAVTLTLETRGVFEDATERAAVLAAIGEHA